MDRKVVGILATTSLTKIILQSRPCRVSSVALVNCQVLQTTTGRLKVAKYFSLIAGTKFFIYMQGVVSQHFV